MDWLEIRLRSLWDRLLNLSLRKALGYYMVIAITAVVFCYIFTHLLCSNWRELVVQKYGLYSSTGYGYFFENGYIENAMSQEEKGYNILWILQVIESGSVLLYSIIAIMITSHFYYKNKLKEPLHLLQQEAASIAREDLSFSCIYESKDEMGEICESFDKMRQQLVINKKNLWNLMDAQRQLNAAFAHDLRTPLTVMGGYIEILTTYYPDGNISGEKFQEILRLMGKQVKRLEDFSDTMKQIHTFEQMKVDKKHQTINNLYGKIQESVKGLQSAAKLQLILEERPKEDEIYCDTTLIIEVFDNLMSNAMRYAQEKVEIKLDKLEDKLLLYIRDDGRGFGEEEFIKAARPYYSGEAKQEHYGLGLSICKMLCEKHGGRLKLSNSIHGGAIAGAEFFCK